MVNSKGPTRRLFTALWPDEAQRQQLRQVLKSLPPPVQGRRVKADNWHITLKYLGACDARQQACLEQQLANLAIPEITLQLDHTGCFPKPQVAWLGCSEVPRALVDLVTELETALLEACGFAREGRDFRPHLTLYRKLRDYRRQELQAPLHFSFSGIALVESLSTPEGVHYEVLKHYPATNR